MQTSIFDPVVTDVDMLRRQQVQEDFGRHLVENRNRMAEQVRRWIESDAKFPLPIYDRLIGKVRQLDPSTRETIATISLLMADQIISGVLATFDKGNDMRSGDCTVNYAIVAQIRDQNGVVIEKIDVNCGKPFIAVWDRYKKWLSRFAPSRVGAADTTNENPARE